MRRIGLLAPMKPELRPLARRLGATSRGAPPGFVTARADRTRYFATVTTMGTAAAAAATERLLALGDVDHVVVCGIAGGISPDVHIGDVLVPETVLDVRTGDELVTAPLGNATRAGTIATSDELLFAEEIASRLGTRGLLAIDMESAGVGRACNAHGVPWTVFRGVSDHLADREVDDAIFRLAKPDGSGNMGAVLKFVVTQPSRVPSLVRLGRGMTLAADRAAEAALRACGEAP
ncbi:MAG: hypothetical protein U0V73_06080 [Acidimicrobiia bacterium]